MFLRWVLEELAYLQGYKSILAMIDINDYNVIMTFTRNKAMLKTKFCIHLEIVKRIAELFNVTPKFVLAIIDYERISDERIV